MCKGEVVLSIDGNALKGLDNQGLARAMMGPAGSVAVLAVRGAGGSTRQVQLVRGSS